MYTSDMTVTAGTDEMLTMIMVIYFSVIGVVLLGALIDFIIRGIGMYKMGKAQEKANPWLAFIPYARTYFQGELSGSIELKKRTIKNPGVWLIVVPIVSNIILGVMYFVFVIVGMFSTLGTMDYYGPDEDAIVGMLGGFIVFLLIFILVAIAFSTVVKVLKVLVNRQIYNRFTTTNMAITHAVLGTIVPFYESITLLVFGRRAEKEKEERDMQTPEYTPYFQEYQEIQVPQMVEEPEESQESQEPEKYTIE